MLELLCFCSVLIIYVMEPLPEDNSPNSAARAVRGGFRAVPLPVTCSRQWPGTVASPLGGDQLKSFLLSFHCPRLRIHTFLSSSHRRKGNTPPVEPQGAGGHGGVEGVGGRGVG